MDDALLLFGAIISAVSVVRFMNRIENRHDRWKREQPLFDAVIDVVERKLDEVDESLFELQENVVAITKKLVETGMQ